ncbi:MAG: hypothetical protein WCI51_05985 [Lentisphaerota bacterium]
MRKQNSIMLNWSPEASMVVAPSVPDNFGILSREARALHRNGSAQGCPE